MIDVYVLSTHFIDECSNNYTNWGVFKTKDEAEKYSDENDLEYRYENVIIEKFKLMD